MHATTTIMMHIHDKTLPQIRNGSEYLSSLPFRCGQGCVAIQNFNLYSCFEISHCSKGILIYCSGTLQFRPLLRHEHRAASILQQRRCSHRRHNTMPRCTISSAKGVVTSHQGQEQKLRNEEVRRFADTRDQTFHGGLARVRGPSMRHAVRQGKLNPRPS